MTAAVLALVVLAGPPAASSRAATTVQTINHYSIAVPAGHLLKDRSPALTDFALYALIDKANGRVKCTLYFGNHPSFPKLQWSEPPAESRNKSRTRKQFMAPTRVEGLMTHSGLTMDGSFTAYSSIHYFADELTPDDLKLVSNLLDSIRVARRHLK